MRRSVLVAAIVAALAASAGAQAVGEQAAVAVPADAAAPAEPVVAAAPAEPVVAAAPADAAAADADAQAAANAAEAAEAAATEGDAAQAATDDAAASAEDAAAAAAAAEAAETADLPLPAKAANALPSLTVQSLAALQSAAATVPKPAAAEVATMGQSFADKVTGAFNSFNYSSVPWNAIAHKVNTQADKAAKQVYAKIENKLPAVNETALAQKIHAPVAKLNATVVTVKEKVAGAVEWKAPSKLNATVNDPKFKDAVNKTLFHPFWTKPEFKALVQDSPVKVTWATPAEIEKRAAAAEAAAKEGKAEPNMFNAESWQANDVEALPDGASKAAAAGAPQTIVLSKTLDDVRALVARISAGQGPTQAEVTKAVEVATPAVSEIAASAAPAVEAAAGKVTAYLQKKAPEVASLVSAPAKAAGGKAAPAPIDVSAVGAQVKSFAQKVAPGAVAAVNAANPAAGAQLAALAKTAGVDVSKDADPLKMDDIAKAIDAVGAKINATVQDPHFIDKVQGVLGKVNATLEAKWNKVMADGVPKPNGAKSAPPKAKLPDPTPALDAVLPPSIKAIVTPPSRRTDADKVVYDDKLGAVVKVSEQAALREEFEANRAATAAAEKQAEQARAEADAEIAKTNEELAAKAKEEAQIAEEEAAEKAAAAGLPEGKGTAAEGAKPEAAAPAKAKAAAAAPASAPAKGAGVVSFKQAPARNATMPPKLEALAAEAGALERELRAKINGTKAAGLAREALAKANAGLDGAFKAGRKLSPDLSGVRDKLAEAEAKAETLADDLEPFKAKGAE